MEQLELDGLRSALRGPYSIKFEAGHCAVVTGPSGVGKSLFLRMIADLDPNQGRVRLGERDRAAMPAPDWRRLVTYVPAESGWWAETVADHMGALDAARAGFAALGLAPALLDAPVAQLSTGERQRAALVRAMIGRPRFLLLDEPTSALDPLSTQLVETALGRLRAEETGLVLVSHDAEQGRRLGDRHFVMSTTALTEVSP